MMGTAVEIFDGDNAEASKTLLKLQQFGAGEHVVFPTFGRRAIAEHSSIFAFYSLQARRRVLGCELQAQDFERLTAIFRQLSPAATMETSGASGFTRIATLEP
jgi:hypothetical protein